MQLMYLKDIALKKATSTKQTNGAYIDTYTLVDNYKVQLQQLTDEISVSMYGANINKMLRISSPKKVLETYLSTKNIGNEDDNISKYYIFYNGIVYKIVAVRERWIDVENIGYYTEVVSL